MLTSAFHHLMYYHDKNIVIISTVVKSLSHTSCMYLCMYVFMYLVTQNRELTKFECHLWLSIYSCWRSIDLTVCKTNVNIITHQWAFVTLGGQLISLYAKQTLIKLGTIPFMSTVMSYTYVCIHVVTLCLI